MWGGNGNRRSARQEGTGTKRGDKTSPWRNISNRPPPLQGGEGSLFDLLMRPWVKTQSTGRGPHKGILKSCRSDLRRKRSWEEEADGKGRVRREN